MKLSKLLLQDLIVSLFELYAPEDSLSASALVDLLGDLDVEPGAARSSISRLKGKEILEHISTPDGPRYTLHPDTRAQQKWNVQRVFAPARSSAGVPWALIIFSVPEPNRQHRYALKRELANLGFGFVAPGVAIAPESSLEEALFRLEQHGFLNYITHFTANYGESADLQMKVREWWDLGTLEKRYRDFIERYAPLLDTVHSTNGELPVSENEALSLYVPLFTRWKPFPYQDPNIPLRLLPVGWPAPRAKFIFLQLHEILSHSAQARAERFINHS